MLSTRISSSNIRIILYFCCILSSNVCMGTLFACELMDLYEEEFGYINDQDSRNIGASILASIQFSSCKEIYYKKCYNQAISSDLFIRIKDHPITKLKSEIDLEHKFGNQKVFYKMTFLGGCLVYAAMSHKRDYDFILRLFAWHRHMTAQLMQAKRFLAAFGKPLMTPDSINSSGEIYGKIEHIKTQLLNLFPNINVTARYNISLNLNEYCSVERLSKNLEDTGINLSNIKLVQPYFEIDGQLFPLSVLIAPQPEIIQNNNDEALDKMRKYCRLEELQQLEKSILVTQVTHLVGNTIL